MRVEASAVERILNAQDIEGLLRLGAPSDEYSIEATNIATVLNARSEETLSLEIVATVVKDTWIRFFGPFSEDEVKKRLKSFQAVARVILGESQS